MVQQAVLRQREAPRVGHHAVQARRLVAVRYASPLAAKARTVRRADQHLHVAGWPVADAPLGIGPERIGPNPAKLLLDERHQPPVPDQILCVCHHLRSQITCARASSATPPAPSPSQSPYTDALSRPTSPLGSMAGMGMSLKRMDDLGSGMRP